MIVERTSSNQPCPTTLHQRGVSTHGLNHRGLHCAKAVDLGAAGQLDAVLIAADKKVHD